MYFLRRERDGEGETGNMSLAIWLDKESGKPAHQHNARPKVGVVMRVGRLFAGTFSTRDWWQTTIITEILEESDHYVKFKTTNSVYEWWEAE